ncbi:putative YigZ family protein [Lactobacillus colini]|uniref:YigZ family protein n=1 Tax=Lactobacillus colini TaxID=1819254 RepID=A0ABS4MD92_9LACO|nr:YigZ family protein [Lactobacillus colini]MBP2057651.1 putative YigZ family protein [Lactobacillus colini]
MLEKKEYLTLKENGAHELVIKKSRFICTMKRTESVEQAQEFIAEVNKKYRDATHNTFAYTIGLNNDQVKASDNGEPSGTAGIPELKALQLMNLKNVTAVVTRYFGGIKLGAGGLIRAYSNSVTQAAEAIGVVRCVLQQDISFNIAYNRIDEVHHYLETNNIFVANQEYATEVTITVSLDLNSIDKFEEDLTDLLAGKVQFNHQEKHFNEIPVKGFNFHEQ